MQITYFRSWFVIRQKRRTISYYAYIFCSCFFYVSFPYCVGVSALLLVILLDTIVVYVFYLFFLHHLSLSYCTTDEFTKSVDNLFIAPTHCCGARFPRLIKFIVEPINNCRVCFRACVICARQAGGMRTSDTRLRSRLRGGYVWNSKWSNNYFRVMTITTTK